MLLVEKNIFDNYFLARYNLYERKCKYPYLDDRNLINSIEVESQKLKQIINQVLEEYINNNNDEYETKKYYFENKFINNGSGMIFKTDNIIKLYKYLLFDYNQISLYDIWMDNISYKKKNNINTRYTYDIVMTDFTGSKFLKTVYENYDKFNFYDDDILRHIFTYKKFYVNNEYIKNIFIKKGIICHRNNNPKIRLPAEYKNDKEQIMYDLAELLDNFFKFSEEIKLIECIEIQI